MRQLTAFDEPRNELSEQLIGYVIFLGQAPRTEAGHDVRLKRIAIDVWSIVHCRVVVFPLAHTDALSNK